MKVPLLDVQAQNAALLPALRKAFERVMASGQLIMGPELENFERAAAEITGTRHAIGVSSGTDAILLALMTLGIGPGDEVLCPSFTFFATAGCIARTGATPVFVDSCAASFNLDVAGARRRIGPRTKAIVPVHLFGQCADMDAVLALAKEHKLYVIEDAAQSLGAANRGRPAGSMGHFGTYSFYPSKNLGGFGDSGLLATNDDELAERARLLRTHGARAKYFHETVGGNFRMDALQAALLSVKLPHLEEYSTRRRANADYYTARLCKLPGVAVAAGQPQDGMRLILPAASPENKHIWNQYTIRVTGGRRDALRDFFRAREIGSEIYYPLPMHLQECFQPAGAAPEALPVCESLARECLSIPVYPELTREQQDAVIRALADFLDDLP